MLWNLEQGIAFLRTLETELKGGAHVALAGSIMYAGVSNKDLDVVIYPHTKNETCTQKSYQRGVNRALLSLGMKRRGNRERAAYWESGDTKHMEVWETADGKRVDFLFLS